MICRLLFLFLTLSCFAMLTGCGGAGKLAGTGTLHVRLTATQADADAVYVDITGVEAYNNSNGWTAVKNYSPALHLNLSDYASEGSSVVLAEVPLTAGKYSRLRLMISSASIRNSNQTYQVNIAEIRDAGASCVGQYNVYNKEVTSLIIDLNADKSFVCTPGTQNYTLYPSMVMSQSSSATEVIGTIECTDALGTTTSIPAGSTFDVYQNEHAGQSSYLISGTTIRSDGIFRIGVLPQGSYDFRITAGAKIKNLTSISISPKVADLGKITVQL